MLGRGVPGAKSQSLFIVAGSCGFRSGKPETPMRDVGFRASGSFNPRLSTYDRSRKTLI